MYGVFSCSLSHSCLTYPSNTHTQLSFFFFFKRTLSRSWGNWKPEEAKFPTSQAICSCHSCMPSLPTEPEPLLSLILRASPKPRSYWHWPSTRRLLENFPTLWPIWGNFFPCTWFSAIDLIAHTFQDSDHAFVLTAPTLAHLQDVPNMSNQPARKSQWSVNLWGPGFL